MDMLGQTRIKAMLNQPGAIRVILHVFLIDLGQGGIVQFDPDVHLVHALYAPGRHDIVDTLQMIDQGSQGTFIGFVGNQTSRRGSTQTIQPSICCFTGSQRRVVGSDGSFRS